MARRRPDTIECPECKQWFVYRRAGRCPRCRVRLVLTGEYFQRNERAYIVSEVAPNVWRWERVSD
jgi:uncharacterized paraquat-inducible protein A